MPISDLTGTPWHVEKMHRKRNDPLRNKNWCVFYQKRDNYCSKQLFSCIGSAHCKYYHEDDGGTDGSAERALMRRSRQNIQYSSSTPRSFCPTFSTLENLDIEKILCVNIENNPNISTALNYYTKNHKFQKPLLVEAISNVSKYHVLKGEECYIIGKQKRFLYLPCICLMKKEELQYYDLFFDLLKPQNRIIHTQFGIGTIVKIDSPYVDILFDNNKEPKTFSIASLFHSMLLKEIDTSKKEKVEANN